MTVLSNVSLRAYLASGHLVIDPLAEDALQPASIDLHLGDEILHVSDCQPPYPANRVLRPGHLYLATTLERIEVPIDLVGFLHGCSTEARRGIVPHQQAGVLDPGYKGRPTLELTVMYPTILCSGDRIAQVVFHRVSPAADPGYSGRYQNLTAPTPALPRKEGV